MGGYVLLLQISASSSDEVIQFDPPELQFLVVPNKNVLSSIKITNTTVSYVSFMIMCPDFSNYVFSKLKAILPPRSTECLTVTRKGTEDAECLTVQFDVWYAVVDADITARDLHFGDYTEHKKVRIVLTKVISLLSFPESSQIRVNGTNYPLTFLL
jgi:hypothetical protein